MDKTKKFAMIITEEDERYDKGEFGLDFFANAPWEGNLTDIIFGDSFDELMGNGEYEGLFFQLYYIPTGETVACGVLDPDTPREEINQFLAAIA